MSIESADPAASSSLVDSTRYWDDVVASIRQSPPVDAWRAYMRRVYARLIAEWLPTPDRQLALKTDLFEEAITREHLLPGLGSRSLGLDYSPAVVHTARERLATEGYRQHLFVVGDLRHVPLRARTIGRILAGSSLDHFREKADIAVSLAELARVLAPGGALAITFDNPHNPIVWLRNHLPFVVLHRLHLVPYYVGATYDRREALVQDELCSRSLEDPP